MPQDTNGILANSETIVKLGDDNSACRRGLKVFLCHAHEDKAEVQALYQQLRAAGVQPWLDEEDLLPGEIWEEVIPKAVEGSDAVIVCLSRKSVNKEGYVQKEIAVALDAADRKPEDTIFLIPAKLRECEVPERLRRWHTVDLYVETGFGKLLRSLQKRATGLGVELRPATHGSVVNDIDGTELVLVPAGDFAMGSNVHAKNERSQCTVYLDEYWIARHPVTNAQYRRFVQATQYVEPKFSGNSRFNRPSQPVVGVTWHDAKAYCEWAGLRLPTEAEWEKAARGADGRLWPWGSDPEPTEKLCNFDGNIGIPTEIGSYPGGVSPYGCHDMAGNVYDWCYDNVGDYRKADHRNPEGSAANPVSRGGCMNSPANAVRCSTRCRHKPAQRFPHVGFRCAR